MSSTDTLIEMLREAKDIPARFVLFDSWFTMPKTVVSVKEENRDVIGMLSVYLTRSTISAMADGRTSGQYIRICPKMRIILLRS